VDLSGYINMIGESGDKMIIAQTIDEESKRT
jgi:hypothetical protein